MKKFFANVRKYGVYSVYSAFASLRADVSGSYFNWLWWILDPFLFMMVYSFVSIIVFGKSEPYFPVFVFLGLGIWDFVNRSITSSVRGVRANKSVLSRVYMPKYILVFSTLFENLFKYLITLSLSLIVALFYRVPFTWNLLLLPLIWLDLFVITFGICCIFLHCGVYIQDLSNVTRIGLRLVFYLSGIFYSIPKRVPQPYANWLLALNPVAMMINETRNVFLYQSAPHWGMLLGWLAAGLALSLLGIYLINRYEQTYVKAI